MVSGNLLSTTEIKAALERWRTELLDLSKMNRLLYAKPSKGMLAVAQPDPSLLFDGLVNRNRKFSIYRAPVEELDPDEQLNLVLAENGFDGRSTPAPPAPGPQPKAHEIVLDGEPKKVEAALYRLRLRARSALMEQGINVLFAAFGMLDWAESDSSELRILSPLALLPVELDRETALAPYRLLPLDDRPIFNPALARKLALDFNLSLDLPTTEDGDLTLDDILDHVRSGIGKHSNWAVRRDVYLGLFSFAKHALYADLEQNGERFAAHPVLRALSGETEGTPELIEHTPTAEELDHTVPPADVYQVLDADGSQQEAIAAVKAGASLVIQGPPGTGKSQTITNIIAESLATGKTVLFVSEKMAALHVVAKRLAGAGLDEFCLEAHSQGVSKERIVRDLERTLRAGPSNAGHGDDGRTLAELEQLQQYRRELNEYVRVLHAFDPHLQMSVFQVHGQVAARKSAPLTPFQIPGIAELSPTQLAQYDAIVRGLASVGQVLLNAERHPWAGCTVAAFSPQLRAQLGDAFDRLAQHAQAVEQAQAEIRAGWGLDPNSAVAGAQWLRTFLDLMDEASCVPGQWLRSASLTPTAETARAYQERIAEYEQRRPNLLHRYSPSVFSLDLDGIAAGFDTTLTPCWSIARGSEEPLDRVVARHEPLLRATEAALAALTELHGAAADLSSRLGMTPPTTLDAVSNLLTLGALVLADPRPTPAWFEPGRLSTMRELAQEAAKQQETIDTFGPQIAERFGDEVFELATGELVEQFETKYGSWLRSMKSGYRRSMGRIRSAMHHRGDLSYTDALTALKRAHRVSTARSWLSARRDDLLTAFGRAYEGQDTDWARVLEGLETVRTIQATVDYGQVPPTVIRVLLGELGPIKSLAPAVDALARARADAVAALDSLTSLVNIGELTPSRLPVAHADLAETCRSIRAWQEQLRLTWGTASAMSAHAVHPPSGTQMAHDLKEARFVSGIEHDLRTASTELRETFGQLFADLDTDWGVILARLGWAGRLRGHFGEVVPDGVISVLEHGGFTSPELRSRLAGGLHGLCAAIDDVRSHFEASRFLPDHATATLAEITHWARSKRQALPSLEEWCDLGATKREAEAAGLSEFVASVIEHRPPTDTFRDAFYRQVYTLWLTAQYERNPALTRFRGRRHEEIIEEFKRLDTRQHDIARKRITTILRRKRPPVTLNMPAKSEPQILLHEAGKRRRFRPMRKLFADLPNLLPVLKPCMLMSPLAVAQFLGESAIYFDVVIFDEASQILPADAVGAIGRGRQLVVVGDQQQLPPTRFFAADAQLADEDEDGEVPESVLDGCIAAGMPQKSLLWHYRSKHEHLIAFSNHNYYDGRLITFPSTDDIRRAVQFVRVPGVYSRSGARVNRIEARCLVDRLVEHARSHPYHSLGVITFSEAQMVAVQTEIDQRKRSSPELETLLREDGAEGFFVKNLENVQGDERDAIFFSVGYGPDEAGKMTMIFGPLNRQGGERRLNVAVTRARQQVVVFASFHPDQIDRSRTKARGVHLLRSYLEFAERGPKALLGEITAEGGEPESPFEHAVASALEAQGLRVVAQVGAGGYRIDLGIKDEHTDRYVLGVECDGATYHSAKTARDRDRLRQQVLEQLGWRIHRIWSTDWVKDPEGETRRVLAALEGARRSQPAQSEALPPREEEWDHYLAPSAPEPIDLDEHRAARTHANEPAKVYGLATTYHYAELPYARYTMNDFDTASNRSLTHFVRICVNQEGPVHVERVIRALGDVFSVGRVGIRIRSRFINVIDNAVSEGFAVRHGAFLWPATPLEPPIRAMDNHGRVRRIAEVPPEEIASAVIKLLGLAFSMGRGDLVTAVAREMGYERTGSYVSAAISKVVDELIGDGRVVDVGGQVRLAA